MFVCVGEKRIKTREYVLIIVIYVPGYRAVSTECLSRYMVSGGNRVTWHCFSETNISTVFVLSNNDNELFNNRDTYFYFYKYVIMII